MVEIQLTYEGELRCSAQHGPSQVRLQTDAPVDNQGLGQSFSPTDLVATGLGACMATIMGIAARKRDLDIGGTRVTVVKRMSADMPRRIVGLDVSIRVPQDVAPKNRELLERAAAGCPVMHSIHPEIEVPVSFEWGS